MASIKTNILFNTGFTMIPNIFIENYLPNANHTFSIIYIFVLKNCFQGNTSFDSEEISTKLNILESDVYNALNYWEKEGLVKINRTGDDLEIEFLEINPEKKEITTVKKPVFLETKPVYSIQEIEVYKKQSEEINAIFDVAERELGKHLNYNDLSILFSFYDWLRLPVDVIEKLIIYCTSNNHRSLRYIEKVALDWSENNINTPEIAEEYILRFNSFYREILKSLGISGRNPVESEIKYMKKWIDEYKMPLDIILEACDKTIMNTGKASFSYAETILADWFKNQVKTLDDVKKLDETYVKSKESKKENVVASQNKTVKKNRIVNYKGRTWDYEKLEKLEKERLLNRVKGS